MKPQNHAVIYIGNVRKFNLNPSEYLTEEIFYWFYEEIRDSPKLQTMLGQIVNKIFATTLIISIWKGIFQKIQEICKLKGKKILFIFDQYNKKSENSSFLEILSQTANANIYITTNTDPNAATIKLPDSSSTAVVVLNEIDNIMEESQLLKLIRRIFSNQTQDFAEQLFFHTKGNLTLIFLFYNYCCLNALLEKGNLNFSEIYGTFSKKYISENRDRHDLWLSENQNKLGFNLESLQEMMAYVDRNYPCPDFNKILLDKRFIYISKDDRLHSINSLISKMFLERYWKANDIETFLNNRGKTLDHAMFGEMFELYFTEKLIQMKNEGNPLKINLGDKEIVIEFYEQQDITYGQKNLPKGITLEGKGYDLVYFHVEKTKGNGVFMKSSQANLPFFDNAVYKKFEKQLLLISYKLNSEFIHSKYQKDGKKINFDDYFVHYYKTYTDKAKKQLGKNFFIVLY